MIYTTTIIFAFISAIYSYVVINFYLGWKKTPEFHENKFKIRTKVSINIAVRNEEQNIEILIKNLISQNIDFSLFEVIFIDDNSDDNTYKKIEHLIKNYKNFRLLKNEKNEIGKKTALKKGIENSENDLIILTDADCYFTENWLSTIIAFYEKHKPKIIISPVVFQQTKKKFSFANLQSIEFLSLITSGAGSSGKGKPILCNAANLAFEKKLFFEFQNPLNRTNTSGDDIFLLLNTKKKYPEKIKFLKSKQAIVTTFPQKNLKSFINQRIRWTSKSSKYTDFDIIFTSFTVFFQNFIIILSLLLGFYDDYYFYLSISLFLIKSIPDLIILKSASKFFDIKYFNLLFLPTQILYIWYIVIIGILGNFIKFSWKGRKYDK